MTKSELIDAIAARADLTKARAEMVVNCVFDTMTGALQDGQGIEIRGFGSFTVRPYKPYDGRNPRTFKSFNEAAEEAGISRLYGGIHFHSAIVDGLAQGRCIGAYAVALKTRK